MRFSTLTLAAAFSQLSIAGYVLEDDYMTDFYGGFEFFTAPDPTEGFVKYVDENTARQSNLINTSMTAGASWGVDFQNQTPQGRPSVRITSKKSYDSGLIVLDVAHMPVGCGTWPAFWTTGPNWPHNGEIDIIEGVNDQVNNAMTLHTGPGCQIGSDKSLFEGSVTTGNCYVKAKGQKDNAGCSIEDPSSKSYGAGLNANGGGVFATQWTSDAISVYFFPRDSVPADVLGDNPDPSSWGKPSASFQGGCDIGNTFKKQQIVFDTTFCGVWAGNPSVWQKSSCSKKAATCEEWVKNNPEAFAEAYWTVNSLKVYQDNGQASPPKPSSAPQQSSAGYVPEPIPTQSSIPTQPSVPTQSPVASPPKPSFPPQQSNPAYGPMPVPTQMPQGRPSFPGPPADAVQSTSLIVPSVSGIFAPIPTSETLSAPVASPPADQAASSPPAEAPSPTTTQGGADPAAPSPDVGAPAPAPVGAGGMRGFQWPKGAGGGSNDSEPTTAPVASPPQNTGAPTQAPSSGAATPSATQSIAQPSNPPAVPEVPAPAPAPTGVANAPVAAPVVPVVTDIVQSVQIVYETVYATVTASAPAATTPPAAKNRRMARFIREHRQRLTRHHAKF